MVTSKVPIFVPIARDGSKFNPSLRRGNGFTVGAKGAERNLALFEDALATLKDMSIPKWRRPNHVGNWGIVSGVDWVALDEN